VVTDGLHRPCNVTVRALSAAQRHRGVSSLLVATVNSLLGLLASAESMDNKIVTGRAQFVPLCRAGEEMSQMQSSRHTVHVQT